MKYYLIENKLTNFYLISSNKEESFGWAPSVKEAIQKPYNEDILLISNDKLTSPSCKIVKAFPKKPTLKYIKKHHPELLI